MLIYCLLVLTTILAEQEIKEVILKLPGLKVNPDTITVMGYSSGGYFANQFHIIYSSTIKGSSQVGGGPYMVGTLPNEGLNSSLNGLTSHALSSALNYEKDGLIDPILGLKDAPKIDIVSDTDPIITNAMMEANQKVFNAFRAKTKFVNNGVVHFFPTESDPPKPKCERGKNQNNVCDYDFAGEMFHHLYSNIPEAKETIDNWKPKNKNATTNLTRFDQREFADEDSGLYKYGHLYVPR